MPDIVVAKPVPRKRDRTKKRDMYAMVCYYYPQYTLEEVAKLPYRDLKLLLRTAEKLEAKKMYELTQIAAAPHTEKGRGVKQLERHFKDAMSK